MLILIQKKDIKKTNDYYKSLDKYKPLVTRP